MSIFNITIARTQAESEVFECGVLLFLLTSAYAMPPMYIDVCTILTHTHTHTHAHTTHTHTHMHTPHTHTHAHTTHTHMHTPHTHTHTHTTHAYTDTHTHTCTHHTCIHRHTHTDTHTHTHAYTDTHTQTHTHTSSHTHTHIHTTHTQTHARAHQCAVAPVPLLSNRCWQVQRSHVLRDEGRSTSWASSWLGWAWSSSDTPKETATQPHVPTGEEDM